jgi:hypothetical protein
MAVAKNDEIGVVERDSELFCVGRKRIALAGVEKDADAAGFDPDRESVLGGKTVARRVVDKDRDGCVKKHGQTSFGKQKSHDAMDAIYGMKNRKKQANCIC